MSSELRNPNRGRASRSKAALADLQPCREPADPAGLKPAGSSWSAYLAGFRPASQQHQHRPAGVPPGWSAQGWRCYLRQIAEACEPLHPERATELRRQAEGIAP